MKSEIFVQGEPELMQQLFGVPCMTDVLRSHFGTEPSPDAVSPAAGAICLYPSPECAARSKWAFKQLQAARGSTLHCLLQKVRAAELID